MLRKAKEGGSKGKRKESLKDLVREIIVERREMDKRKRME